MNPNQPTPQPTNTYPQPQIHPIYPQQVPIVQVTQPINPYPQGYPLPLPAQVPGGDKGQLDRTLQLREINRLIPEHKGSSLGSIEYRPKHVRFATQNKQEKVYILVRRHWITNLQWAFRYFLFSLLPIVTLQLLNFFDIEAGFINAKTTFLTMLAFYSIIFTNVIKEFVDWYFDPYIVTNERVLEYDYKPFASYTINEAALDDIEDVTETAKGFLPNFLGYGDLEISTASDLGIVRFKSIPDPTHVRDIVSDLSKISKKFHQNHP